MRVIWSLFLSALLSSACTAYAQNDTLPYQIDEQATARAPWNVGDIVAKGEVLSGVFGNSKVYRKFIGITNKGYFVVQDFYQENNKKYSVPIAIIQQDFVEDITQSDITQPFDGMWLSWYKNGQTQLEGHYVEGQK